MTRHALVLVLVLVLGSFAAPRSALSQAAADPVAIGRLYQEAWFEETANGDLEKAAALYKKILETDGADPELRKKAEARLAAVAARQEKKAAPPPRRAGPEPRVDAELALEREADENALRLKVFTRTRVVGELNQTFRVAAQRLTDAEVERLLRAVLRTWQTPIQPTISARDGAGAERIAAAYALVERARASGEDTPPGARNTGQARVHVLVKPEGLDVEAALRLGPGGPRGISERDVSLSGKLPDVEALSALLGAVLGGDRPLLKLEVVAQPGAPMDSVVGVYKALEPLRARLTGKIRVNVGVKPKDCDASSTVDDPRVAGEDLVLDVPPWPSQGGDAPAWTNLGERLRACVGSNPDLPVEVLPGRDPAETRAVLAACRAAGAKKVDVVGPAEEKAGPPIRFTAGLADRAGADHAPALEILARRLAVAGYPATPTALFREVARNRFELIPPVPASDRLLVEALLTGRKHIVVAPVLEPPVESLKNVVSARMLGGEQVLIAGDERLPLNVGRAEVARDALGGPTVRLEVPERSDQDALEMVTTAKRGKRLALLVGGDMLGWQPGLVVCAPVVREPIRGPSVELSGLTERQAAAIAAVLNGPEPDFRSAVSIIDR